MIDTSESKSQLLAIPEVRERLGGIGRTTVWRLIGDGDLVGVRVGARSFVLESSLDAFIAQQVAGRNSADS